MSHQICMATAQTQNPDANVHRRSANYRPSLWGDHFLSYSNKSEETIDDSEQVQGLKEEVQRMLMAPIDNLLEKLELIDAIQRLGVSYHFEDEIDEVLQQIHRYHYTCDVQESDDALYTIALHFRLLRQQGYNILSDIFNKFKDNMGNFKESLTNDVKGMLSFYEATHMRVHGEDILDEALKFTTTHLESMVINFSPPLATQVSHALNRPIQKCLPRVEARQYFSIYQENASHNEILLNFAKLDFNMLQKQHQKELGHISRWWKGIDVATNLSFAQDRVVELYFWILGVYFEPQYSLARRILTKTICMASIIDDIYDVYGTHEELELFTDTIKRWDISCIDQLPKYMKLCYKVLLDVFEEIEEEMCKDGRLYCVYYAKVAMKKLVQAYFEEAVWLKEKYIPTMEEYMSNALISCGYLTLSTISFIGMGDIVTKAALEWVIKEPKIVRAASIINRLMDDIVSNEFEQERGHVVSGIECYMRQYGLSKQEVHDEFRKQIVNAWKDINKECFRPTEVPEPLLTRVVNLARVMDLLYKDEDAYTHLGGVMVEGITSMLVDPVPV
ncbi:(-)-germacrene D synthase-like [Quercus lobata]|uniref:(-)-germacrene D synthase-like n=1 Tax=Quercus lobata TaxID=97700 RepID=UPI001244B694|nr:(-)-germacrene D synthase-like [Quercus lobata]